MHHSCANYNSFIQSQARRSSVCIVGMTVNVEHPEAMTQLLWSLKYKSTCKSCRNSSHVKILGKQKLPTTFFAGPPSICSIDCHNQRKNLLTMMQPDEQKTELLSMLEYHCAGTDYVSPPTCAICHSSPGAALATHPEDVWPDALQSIPWAVQSSLPTYSTILNQFLFRAQHEETGEIHRSALGREVSKLTIHQQYANRASLH